MSKPAGTILVRGRWYRTNWSDKPFRFPDIPGREEMEAKYPDLVEPLKKTMASIRRGITSGPYRTRREAIAGRED